MNSTAHLTAALLISVIVGCGSDTASSDGGDAGSSRGEDSASSSTTGAATGASEQPSTETTAPGDTATTVSPGDACPLVGMFRECSGDNGAPGLAYCDDFGGELRFGPCLTQDPECDLLDPLTCMDIDDAFVRVQCQLVDGVPRWVATDDCDFSTSG